MSKEIKKETVKKTKSTTDEAEKPKPKVVSTTEEGGDIKEASIAKFMRKRTQLVGFDYGLNKHTQFAVEFIDNSLDAIEKFQWDSTSALDNLINDMGRVSSEFERYDYDVENLKQLVQGEGQKKDQISRLTNLMLKTNQIIQSLDTVQSTLNKRIAFDNSVEKTDDKETSVPIDENIKITTTSFPEEFDKFIKKFQSIKDHYNYLVEEIHNLEINPRFMFTLDKDLFLEDFNYFTAASDSSPSSDMKNSLISTSDDEIIPQNGMDIGSKLQSSMQVASLNGASLDESVENGQTGSTIGQQAVEEGSDDEEARELRKKVKKASELDEEINNIRNAMDEFITPIVNVVDNEPMVILKLQEEEAPTVYQEKGEKDAFLYTIEVFDNGTGMRPEDLLKFGKYLASSKSQKLRQTRGSQGFGSPSAFSDAQNTTGRPITVISKHFSEIFGIASEFYTTEKNTKVYVVPPKEIECLFTHGTYIKLQYLNKKYVKGYIDSYIECAALMNSHVTFVYIDPKNEERKYPRRVNYFPKEPKYALPHPSSFKIGDFQDLLRGSENMTVSAFLTDNFVRMSTALAHTIVEEAEFELERKLNYLNIEVGFLSVINKPSEQMLFVREEERIFGRSKNPRPMKVVYMIPEGELKNSLWEKIKVYLSALKNRNELEKQNRSIDKDIQKIENGLDASKTKNEDRKKIKEKEKEAKEVEKQELNEIKVMENTEKDLAKLLHNVKLTDEITDTPVVDKIFEIVRELMISKTRPAELTQTQIEYLYMAFKNQKYMAPPTDTAIPVGETALETALIKQFKLTISNRVDYFGNSEEAIKQMGDFERQKNITKNLAKFTEEKLLAKGFDYQKSVSYDPNIEQEEYQQVIYELDLVHTSGDDFVAAFQRKPTSGKGLAFVVEAVMAYSPNPDHIPPAKKASSVIYRYVNRTPKLRDNSDCALFLGIQSVSWKNYKIADVFENGIPRGNYVIFVNCSGPYTHLMFKSQSKNALAEDEVLLKEVKFCMEVIGRKIRNYMSKREMREQRQKRSKLIEKNIPAFIDAIYNVAKINPKYKDLTKTMLEEKINQALAADTESTRRRKKVEGPEGAEGKLESAEAESESESSEEGEEETKPKIRAESEEEEEGQEEGEEEEDEDGESVEYDEEGEVKRKSKETKPSNETKNEKSETSEVEESEEETPQKPQKQASEPIVAKKSVPTVSQQSKPTQQQLLKPSMVEKEKQPEKATVAKVAAQETVQKKTVIPEPVQKKTVISEPVQKKTIISEPVQKKTTVPEKVTVQKPAIESKPATINVAQGAQQSISADLSDQAILNALSDGRFYLTSELAKKMNITNNIDGRFLQTRLVTLRQKGIIEAGKKEDKILWKIKK
jgi:DNA topoisomerase VI B subunit